MDVPFKPERRRLTPAEQTHHDLAQLLKRDGQASLGDEPDVLYLQIDDPDLGNPSLSNHFDNKNNHYGSEALFTSEDNSALMIEPRDKDWPTQYLIGRPANFTENGLYREFFTPIWQDAGIEPYSHDMVVLEIHRTGESSTGRVIQDPSEAPMIQAFLHGGTQQAA